MEKSKFVEKLSKLNKVLSVTGKEYGSITLKGDKLFFIRGHKSTYERIPVSELFALFNHGPHINNAIAKSYISGRVQSPAVSIVNSIRSGSSIETSTKDFDKPTKGNSKTLNNTLLQNKKTKSQTNHDLAKYELLDFRSVRSMNGQVLTKTGFYFIQLKSSSTLPSRYKARFGEQEHRIIYIGKAEGQSLAGRLDQELLHTSPGTFFRSIGAVLDKTPIPGHLRTSKRKNNYKFSPADTDWIIGWLSENVEVAIIPYSGDFKVENSIIESYAPILNHTGNPRKCAELIEDRAKCRKIASGF